MQSLHDVTVLELVNPTSPTHLRLASGMATKLLADLGVRVIRILPPGSDLLEDLEPLLPDGTSAVARFLNTSKLVLQTTSDEDRSQALERLLASGVSAIVMEEGEPLHPLLLATETPLIEIATWPRGVVLEGSDSEFTVLAASGLLDIIGDPTSSPLRLGGHQAAYAAGLSAFTATMIALAQADAGGEPSRARISLVETATWINWKAVAGVYNGDEMPTRPGELADFQVMRCSDGWFAFVFTPNEFDRVHAMFEGIDLSDLPIVDQPSLRANIRVLTQRLSPWFAERARDDVFAIAQRNGIPAGPVYSPRDLLSDPQYEARSFLVSLTDDSGSVIRMPRIPLSWNGVRFDPRDSQTVELDTLIDGVRR